ncbi:AbrB/MazE/SpoVT family DNA-binding domain-containing protein [Candidatus Woesearchaeota archaeon]|nr:AbrB/MazE/SpoVT family DNA-binding domain-containing protein [Candidatus Woesearchaeota archaeon]
MVTAKKWGSSIAVIIPKEIVKSQNIKEGDDIAINIFKKGDLTDVFGTLKTKLTGQRLKDLSRHDWESSSDRKFRRGMHD